MKGRITMERHYGLTAEGIKEALEQGYSYKELMEEIEEMIAGQYAQTIHIDNIGMLRVDGRTRSFEEFSLSGDPGTWSREIINVIENLDHEKK